MVSVNKVFFLLTILEMIRAMDTWLKPHCDMFVESGEINLSVSSVEVWLTLGNVIFLIFSQLIMIAIC